MSCIDLISITISDNISRIGDFAFVECSNLTTINYSGTQAEWNAIDFGNQWNSGCGEITVHCTDGDITIPAN